MLVHAPRPRQRAIGRLASLGGLLALALLGAACAPTAPAVSPTAAAAPGATAAGPSSASSPIASRPSPVAAASPAAKPSGAVSTPVLPKPEQLNLTIALTTLEPSQLAPAFAEDLGLYRKYGFEKVETTYFDGDAKGLQALVGGQVDAGLQSTGAAIASQTTDVPVVITGMTATILTDALMGAKDVKTAADLKGKKIAVSTFGSTTHGSILLSLKALGLTDQDVTIVQIGGQSARVAALQAGSVAAAPVDVALEADMKKQGFNTLVRLPDTPLEFGRSGLTLRREWIQKNPNATLALVAAVLEAQNAIWTQTDGAVDSFARWARLDDRAKAEAQVKEFIKTGRRDLRWSQDAFLLARDVQSIANPALKDVDVTRAYDMQWLDKLKEMGFNRAIGLPGS